MAKKVTKAAKVESYLAHASVKANASAAAIQSAYKIGSSGDSVGNLRVSSLGLSQETIKLAAGGVKGALLVFPAVVDQRPAILVDHVADKLFCGALS